jgi:DNA-binding transcriptional MerR regulator
MFKIGDFSMLSRVSVKTLRYYDEIGLLKPVKVDRFTSYRYYSAEHLPRLNYIIALKDMGLSLEEIATLVNNQLTPHQMRDIFVLKRGELQRRVSEEQRQLERVEKLLVQLEKEGKMPDYQIVIKKLEPMKVGELPGVEEAASLIYKGPYETISQAYQALMAWCEANGYELAGPDREVYLTSPEKTTDPSDYITELQQPVKKAG